MLQKQPDMRHLQEVSDWYHEMEKLMGKKDFQKILGSLVYKPQGKITLVPESDKRPPIQTETAEADFKEDE